MSKVKLCDVCVKQSSKYAQKDLNDLHGEYPVFGASGFIKNISEYHQENDYVAVVKDGAGIGRTMFLPGKSSVIGTLQYLLPKKNVLPKYLYYAVRSMHLEKYYTGATIPHIYFKDYQKEEFNLPELSEQKNVVFILEKLEKVISYRKRQLESLDKLVKSRFVEMFGDPVINSRNWRTMQLQEVGEWKSGGTPSRTNIEYFKGDIDWYSAGELNQLYLDGAIEKITQKAIENSSAKMFHKGSMLVGMYDTAAFKMGILKKDSASNQACANVMPNESVHVVWLYYNLMNMKEYFLSNRRGIRQKNLSLGMIKKFEIPVPPLELQYQFTSFTQQVDKLKFSVIKQLSNTKKLIFL